MSFLPILATAAAEPASRPVRPNVILIVTDDQGCGDFSIAGNPVLKTPHLDSLATGGARMTRFYVCPVCAPTRAALMTGRYNYRTRAIDTYQGRAMMEPAEVTIAEVLRGAGYATGIFGKWHLGDNYPMRAMDQGFEEALILRGGGIGQSSDPPGGEGKYTDPILFHNGREVQAKGYCTDVYFDAAGEWMENSARSGRSFFAYIATNAPHSPLDDVPREEYERFREVDFSPVLVPPSATRPSPAQADMLARVFAMIADIDANVGRLLHRLEALGALENTLILFVNDNGPNSRRYVGDMRGMKAEVYEGGIRGAFFARWPARIPAGHTSAVAAAHIDVLPTILDACGVPAPAGVRLDGRSILPLLTGAPADWPRRTLFIQSHRGDVPVRYHQFTAVTDRWKLLNASGFDRETPAGPPRFELYDLVADPAERRNRAAEEPEVVEQLRREYEAWFDDVGATRPDNYAPPRISIGTAHEDPVVLTRQNWRMMTARGGGPPGPRGGNGLWKLRIARAGTYRVTVRLPATAAADGQVELNAGTFHRAQQIEAGDVECVFAACELPEADADLSATITIGGESRGAWQVEVERER